MRIAAGVLMGLEAFVVVWALIGVSRPGAGGDAAGRGLAQGYAAVATVFAVLLLTPALILQLHDHSGWALGLCLAFLLPVFALVVVG
jgi:hypothetical protein